jgi:hypothetical protein
MINFKRTISPKENPEAYLNENRKNMIKDLVTNGAEDPEKIFKFFETSNRFERRYYAKLNSKKEEDTSKNVDDRKKGTKIAAITILSIVISISLLTFLGPKIYSFGEYISAYIEDGPYYPVYVEYNDGGKSIIVQSSYKSEQDGSFYYRIYKPIKKSEGRGRLVKKVQEGYAYQPYY